MHRAVLISVLTALLTLGACNGDGEAAPVHTYVSLGDSFTSGAGLPQTTSAVCQRSRLAYPALVAKKLDARLADASCGGAATTNVNAPQLIGAVSAPPSSTPSPDRPTS